MALRSIEQARASAAWRYAESNIGNDKFKTIVTKIPTYIKTNGLMNTLAFLHTSRDYKPALDCIRDWLTEGEYAHFTINGRENKDLLNHLLNIQPDQARLLIQYTVEVLALFNWLRRFVKSE